MSQEMERFGGTSEEYEDEVMGIGVKGEGGEGDRDGDGDEEKKSCMFDADGMMIEEAIGFQQQFESQSQSKRSRPKEEKERTKLRERHRRAITARILAGLRRHGNYNLRVRADINDVIAALAREAGWVVHPDGTTYPSRSPQIAGVTRTAAALSTPGATAVMSPSSPMVQTQTPISYLGGGVSSLRRSSSVDYPSLRSSSVPPVSSLYNFASSTPLSGSLAVMGSRGGRAEDSPLISNCCIETVDEDNQVIEMPPRVAERDFAGTPHVPVYVMLPLGIINMKCELVDPDGLRQQLKVLKSINVDGVMVDCWWGIVEAHTPQEYNWSGYKCLFQIIRELKMKLQVVMSFHECGGNVGDDVCIPLPHWIAEIGRNNPNIFFTDREGNHNYECLTWGIDKERVLRGRTAVEVYFDYMRSFRVEFDEFFVDGIISEIEVGLGPCGELRYPSYPVNHGWKYPGIGEFQCYDLYLMKSLKKAAEARGHSIWARGPDNAGSYNSGPHETLFFCDGGDYDSYYGRFFLYWYSQVLVDHGDRVLSLAKLAFEGTCIATKLSGIHWWYKTASHAAELTAGFYNPCNRDGYAAIASMLKKHGVALNFTCVELRTLAQHEDYPEALADPEALVWQVLNAAWDACIPVASENALPCYDREGYNKILENAKPMNDPDQRHLSAFTYLRLTSQLLETENFVEFERFVKRMHGEAVSDLQL